MQSSIIITIADLTIKLICTKSKGENVRKMFVFNFKRTFRPYLVTESCRNCRADVELEVIEREKILGSDRIEQNGKIYTPLFQKKGRKNIIYYDLSTQQVQEIVRKLIFKKIYLKKGLIIHASSVVNKGKADLFIAPSGGGKSTLLQKLSSRLAPFVDDAVLIKKSRSRYLCYQIPFADQYTSVHNAIKKIPLGNIYFIHKAKNNRILRIDQTEAVRRLISRSVREKNMVKNTLLLCMEHRRFFDLYFSHLSDPNSLLELLASNTS